MLAAGVVAGVLGLPSVAVVILVATVGAGIAVSDADKRRTAGARRAAGDAIDGFPLQLPAERVAVGARLQFRLLPPTRALWAPGLLCVGPGAAQFVPSKEAHRARAWGGPVTSSELLSNGRTSAVVRLHGPEGAAQFVVSHPPPNLAEALPAWIATPRGSAPQ